MLRMLRKDRVLLRNVVIAVVGGTLGAMIIGTTCLGRDRAAPDTAVSSSDEANEREPTSVTQTTSAGVEPVGSTNITSTTIIVNPAEAPAPAPAESGQSPPAPAPATVVIQAPPASAPPASSQPPPPPAPTDTGPTESNPAPSASVSPESVEAQDQRDQQRELESQQSQVIIPMPLPQNAAPSTPLPHAIPSTSVPGTPGAMYTAPVPGSTAPPSSYYPPTTPRPGQLGPNVPNGGASLFNPSNPTAPRAAPIPHR